MPLNNIRGIRDPPRIRETTKNIIENGVVKRIQVGVDPAGNEYVKSGNNSWVWRPPPSSPIKPRGGGSAPPRRMDLQEYLRSVLSGSVPPQPFPSGAAIPSASLPSGFDDGYDIYDARVPNGVSTVNGHDMYEDELALVLIMLASLMLLLFGYVLGRTMEARYHRQRCTLDKLEASAPTSKPVVA